MKNAKNTLLVISMLAATADGGHPIAFYEKAPEHPKGEVLVTSPTKPVEVGDTAAVRAKIAAKVLAEYSGKNAPATDDTNFNVVEGDTVESLLERFKGRRDKLFELAGKYGIDAKQNQSNIAIAEAILEAAGKEKEV